jgi:hypothetical protein
MIKVIGPRDKRDPNAINTTSHSYSDWASGLSPFNLGPIQLYDNHTARIFENAWQFSKLYPEHADSNGEPTPRYFQWAKTGWDSTRPFRYPLGKGRKPICSLWNQARLDYIEARKRIYLPLYQQTVKTTNAYRKLQNLYQEQGSITLFDFDGYDHTALGMSLNDVLHCPTKICGHAFILAMMLTAGTDFQIQDLAAIDDDPSKPRQFTQNHMFPITVVNRKTFKGPSQYIGRAIRNLKSSPLGNKYRVKPHGPYEREQSVLILYKQWLWKEMQDKTSAAYNELKRLAEIAKTQPLNLSCWCAPQLCHGEIVKKAIEFLIKQNAS